MDVNWKWSAQERTVLRLVAGLVGIVMVSMGGLLVLDRHNTVGAIGSDPLGHAGTAMLALGVLFLLVAIRGRIIRCRFG
jgi:hypothetical protein